MKPEDAKSEKPSCNICGGPVDSHWDPNYGGLRGTCKKCGANWPES